ncbi:MAG: YbaB/EbfC family nucleoid-associated protein [Candidatus Absconditabacteria bacterium]|nr:YbaB/EbfC family nucleoid-associated protein [Candidatus Absconditabacteria bacterium]MDD4714005.1 YbaB/EbfC family nucleoid-associated protein [Candidatus Absconditabacteria bacterium]
MKKMYDKYKQLEKVLKNLVIRAKEGKYDDYGEEKDAIIVDISGEMKLKDLQINDLSLLDPTKKVALEGMLVSAFQKAQTKAQEIVAEKTKEILGVDTNDLAGMLGGGGMPGLS